MIYIENSKAPDPTVAYSQWRIDGKDIPTRKKVVGKNTTLWLPRGIYIFYSTERESLLFSSRLRSRSINIELPDDSEHEVRLAVSEWWEAHKGYRSHATSIKYPALDTYYAGVSVLRSFRSEDSTNPMVRVEVYIPTNIKRGPEQYITRSVGTRRMYMKNKKNTLNKLRTLLGRAIEYRAIFDRGVWEDREFQMPDDVELDTMDITDQTVAHIGRLDLEAMLRFGFTPKQEEATAHDTVYSHS